MRLPLTALLVCCSGCTSSSTSKPDAMLGDAMIDAPPCTPTVLFDGASAPAAQGWLVAQQESATLTQAADHVRLVTATTAGRGAQLLLYRPSTLPTSEPFAVQVELLLESVSPHNALDAAAAILASFTPPFGASAERAQMIYLDANALGWADDTQSHAVAIANGGYHTFRLSVDAAKTLRVAIDGVPALSRASFATNGTLAIGDQTNDPNVEATLRLRKVTRLCL